MKKMFGKRLIAKLFRQSADGVGQLPVEGQMPEFEGIGPWLNHEPITKEALKGKVVLVDFWTYSCVNCLRTLPYVRAWHQAYAKHGLVVIGVHTPEFEFEKEEANVRKEMARLGIEYPVVLDNDYRLWNRYRNHYWPAHYFADALGRLRAHHFGEGGYGHSEEVIRKLLHESGAIIDSPPVSETVQANPGGQGRITPETYLGFNRLEYLGSPESVVLGQAKRYSSIQDPAINIFYLDGLWQIEAEYAVPQENGSRISFRVVASEVNLVMVGKEGGVRAKVMLDGQPLSEKTAGQDCWSGGEFSLEVHEGRMYRLVRLDAEPDEHLVEIIFLDPGAQVYAFTFG